MATGITYRNLALSHLTTGDLDLIEPHLVKVGLPLWHRLSQADRPIEQIHFLETGIASCTMSVDHRPPIEIGIIALE